MVRNFRQGSSGVMSAWGQTRRFGRQPPTSGLPPLSGHQAVQLDTLLRLILGRLGEGKRYW
jgi:hypothetical protein